MRGKEKTFEVSYSTHELFTIRVRAYDADQAKQMVEGGNFDPGDAVCMVSELAHVNKVEEVP